jgi:hypothetical protein
MVREMVDTGGHFPLGLDFSLGLDFPLGLDCQIQALTVGFGNPTGAFWQSNESI